MPPDQARDKPRIDTLRELIGTVLAYVVMGAIALVVIDFLFSSATGQGFGRISGWMAALPTVFVFTDQFRRYEGPSRWAVSLTGVVLGLGAGTAAAALAPPTWLPMVAGGIGGLVAALVYATLWHTGISIYGEERH
ncbi:hypothetical protein [Glycomyces xiaoerkulensis]|uniref:hypothetical protein n=1 Tax=Glycomyces xiaoerkulensis TaxID=2038139 RepID=UPI0018E44484|nr:hypothetical protein [Glycomyces xiaoerkulensis]